METEYLSIFLKVLIAIATGIVTLGGACAVLSKFFSPFKKMEKRIETLEKEFDELKRFQNSDHNEIKLMNSGIENLCKCSLALTDHALTGNSIENLKKAKEDMRIYLIEK